MTAKALIEGVLNMKRPTRSLSSELRVYIAGYFHNSAPRYGFPDPVAGSLLGLSA